MVAIQHPHHDEALAVPSALPAHVRPSHRPDRAHLTVVEGGRSAARMAAVYRRRRVVAAVVVPVVVIALALGLLAGARAVASAYGLGSTGAPAVVAPAGAEVVVQPGDTLWSIARRLQPTGDIVPLVDRLARAHGPAPLMAGERLSLAAVTG